MKKEKKSKKEDKIETIEGDSIKEAGRIVAGAYYDMQEVRMSSLSRIRDIVRRRVEKYLTILLRKRKTKKTM